jgi:hypothetical protein
MPWTSSDVDTLKAAIAAGRGARVIAFGDQSITFHSVPEMLQLLAVMQAEVAATTNGGTPRTRYASVGKGV